MQSDKVLWLNQFVKKQLNKKDYQARRDLIMYLKGSIDSEKNNSKKQYLQGYYDCLTKNTELILKTENIEKQISILRIDVNSVIEKQQKLDQEFYNIKKWKKHNNTKSLK